MSTRTIPITKELLSSMTYTNLVKLATHLQVVNPRLVHIKGTVTLDELGNLLSIDAEVIYADNQRISGVA